MLLLNCCYFFCSTSDDETRKKVVRRVTEARRVTPLARYSLAITTVANARAARWPSQVSLIAVDLTSPLRAQGPVERVFSENWVGVLNALWLRGPD